MSGCAPKHRHFWRLKERGRFKGPKGDGVYVFKCHGCELTVGKSIARFWATS